MAPATPDPNVNPFDPISDEANAQRRADLEARAREAASRKKKSQGDLERLQEYLHRPSIQQPSTQREGQIQSQAPQPSTDVDKLVQQTAALKTKDSQGTPEPEDSMQGVVQGSPQTPDARYAWIRKRAREWRREEEDRQDKKARQQSPEPVVPMVERPSDEMEIVEEINELENISRREIQSPTKLENCAFAIWSKDDIPGMTEPMGNPFLAGVGWSVKVLIEAGRYGLPEISLSFRVNKPRKDKKGVFTDMMRESISTKAEEIHQFEASWRPGVRVHSTFMIDDLETRKVAGTPLGEFPHLQSIIDMHPKPKEGKNDEELKKEEEQKVKNITRLMAITFTSNALRIVNAHENHWRRLPKNVKAVLKRLFLSSESFKVTIWVRAYPNLEEAETKWVRWLRWHVNDHLPPLVQYQSPNGSMVCDWDRTELIHVFGKGMYNIHPNFNGVPQTDKPPTNFYAFPQKVTWQEHCELGVTAAMPVVRGMQYQKAQVSHINGLSQGAYCQRIPIIPGQPKVDNEVFMFVRVAGKTRSPPPLNTKVKVCFDNSIKGVKPHIHPKEDKNFMWGTIVANADGCSKTQTNFCVWLRVSKKMNVPWSKESLEIRPDEKLASVYLWIDIDETAALRELIGAQQLTDPAYAPETLGSIRAAIMQDAKDMKPRVENLCTKHPERWLAYKEQLAKDCQGNQEQYDIVVQLEKVDNGVVCCAGPPGTGKTKSLARTAIGALDQDLKVLVAGPQNISVDNCANAIWDSLQDKYKSGKEEKYFMRLETKGSELRAYLAIQNYASLTASEADQMPSFRDMPAIDEIELTRAMTESLRDYKEQDAELMAEFHRCGVYKDAIDTHRATMSRKRSNVPIKMISGWHIHDLVLQDRIDADLDMRMVKAAWLHERASEEQIQSLILDGRQLSDEMLDALRADAITEAQFTAMVESRAIKSEAERSRSALYQYLAQKYITSDGVLPRKHKQAFEKEWGRMMGRAFQRLDCLLATCNNVGSGIIGEDFKPDVTLIDEAGQVSLASVAIVLTMVLGWRAVFLFGDNKQLYPFDTAGRFNEFRDFAKLSILGLFTVKNFNVIRLKTQYRMCPPIVSWVNKFFYNNILVNAPVVLQDNEIRKAARAISLKHYGIKGEKGEGSEYFVINVKHGISRRAKNSPSAVNYANADAIALLVDQCLEAGIPLEDIGILTYYANQKDVQITRLRRTAEDKGRTWELGAVERSTVDAYQGKEVKVGILDLVLAQLTPKRESGDKKPKEEEEDDEDLETTLGSGKITAHVRDAHRFCCGLTRMKYFLAVVCQAHIIGATVKDRQKKTQGALGAMLRDAYDRGLVYEDNFHYDTSPDFQAQMASWTAQAKRDYDQTRLKETDLFLNQTLPKARRAQLFDTEEGEVPVFQSRFGKTSKPLDVEKSARDAIAARTQLPRSLRDIRNDPTSVLTVDHPQSLRKKEKRAVRKAEDAKKQAAPEEEPSKVVQLTPEETEEARLNLEKATAHNEATKDVRQVAGKIQ